MRKAIHYLAVVLVLFSGCYHAKPPLPETPFFRDFSLVSVVERLRLAELKPQSGDEGKSEAFGEPLRRRRNFSETYLIDEQSGARLDQAKFINQLNVEIQKLIGDSGLHLDGRSSGENNFQLDYSQGGYMGSLDVAGTRAEGNRFKLWAVIREAPRDEKH